MNSADALTLFYQVVIAGVIACGNLSPEEKARLCALHALVILGLFLFLWVIKGQEAPGLVFVHSFYPLVAMLFFYKEIGGLVHSYFEWYLGFMAFGSG